jgi:hypothetical protein
MVLLQFDLLFRGLFKAQKTTCFIRGRALAVVRDDQAPKRIEARPGRAGKRAQLGQTERCCTSGFYNRGFYSGSGVLAMSSASKACGSQARVLRDPGLIALLKLSSGMGHHGRVIFKFT